MLQRWIKPPHFPSELLECAFLPTLLQCHFHLPDGTYDLLPRSRDAPQLSALAWVSNEPVAERSIKAWIQPTQPHKAAVVERAVTILNLFLQINDQVPYVLHMTHFHTVSKPWVTTGHLCCTSANSIARQAQWHPSTDTVLPWLCPCCQISISVYPALEHLPQHSHN